MKILTGDAPEAGTERYGTRLIHEEPNVRVVAFHLLPGQEVPPHRTDSTVVVHVVEGEGLFRGADREDRIGPGGAAVYAPGEVHSMMPAGGGSLRFLAMIAPAPR